jgi:predicted MFS family arabinose efflux permease
VEFKGGGLGVVGVVVAAYGLAQLLLRLPLGVASDRFGRRKPFLALGFAASSAACIGFVYAPDPWVMVGARFISGISACAWVAFTVLYASYFPPGDTTRAMAYITFCNTLAVMLSTAVGGRLADMYGWLAPFWAAAGVGLLGLISLFAVYEEASPKPDRRSALNRFRAVLNYPELIFASIVAAFGQYTTFATHFGFVPTYAVTIGATKTELGILTMAGTLAGALAVIVSGYYIAPRLGPRYTVCAGYVAGTAGVLVIPYIESVGILYVSQILAGFGRGAAYPILMGLAIARLPEREKATAMGFFQAVYAVGMFAGPITAGAIGGRWGYTTLFLTTGLVSAVTAIVALRLPRKA